MGASSFGRRMCKEETKPAGLLSSGVCPQLEQEVGRGIEPKETRKKVRLEKGEGSMEAQLAVVAADVVYRRQVGYITLEIREPYPGCSWYEIRSVTKYGERFVADASSWEEAQQRVDQEEREITRRIQERGKGMPTARQLMTLFSLKIPIAVDLTFGQASDLIDAALTEKRNERRKKIRLVEQGAASSG
jgi:hypothetical protein